jgi:hypothetical protein
MLTEGMELGGFVPCERMHAGSMASLWRVERPGETVPRVMKRPRVGLPSAQFVTDGLR